MKTKLLKFIREHTIIRHKESYIDLRIYEFEEGEYLSLDMIYNGQTQYAFFSIEDVVRTSLIVLWGRIKFYKYYKTSEERMFIRAKKKNKKDVKFKDIMNW